MSRALLNAVTRIHGSEGLPQLERTAVESTEQLMTGAAAALFADLDGTGLMALRAAGPRWRTADRDTPAWLTPLTGSIAGLVRGGTPRRGRLCHPGRPQATDVEFRQVHLPSQACRRRTLVIVWPALTARTTTIADHVLDVLGEHLSLAFRHADSASRGWTGGVTSAADNHTAADRTRLAQMQVLGELAASVTHDLSNALTTVLGLSRCLLAEEPADPRLRSDIERILGAGERMAALVDRLRFVSQAPNPALRARVSLHDLAIAAVESLVSGELPRSASGRPLPVRLVSEGGGPAMVHVEPEAMVSVIRQLVLNAVEATPDDGDVVLTVKARETTVQLAVSDRGTGMPAALLARVFDPFVTTRGRRGRGLGLSVCWHLVTAQGGTLAVASESGRGTTVTLTFPRADVAEV